MDIYLLVCGLGLLTGCLAGLTGIGGGIIMAPLLLYAPQWFGLDPLSMRTVAGLTIVQGLLASISGAFAQRQLHRVSTPLALYMGTTIFIASVLGGMASGLLANEILMFLFACLALSATVLMLLPMETGGEDPAADGFTFYRWRAVASAAGVGLLGGLVGQGGSFILIPLMSVYVKVPLRISVGSNHAIILLSTLAGFIGKAVTGQIAWLLIGPIILTVPATTYLGARVSNRLPVNKLRRVLAVLIAAAALWIAVSPWIA